jgi:hypothetical protein
VEPKMVPSLHLLHHLAPAEFNIVKLEKYQKLLESKEKINLCCGHLDVEL